jgi:hypothetical protein
VDEEEEEEEEEGAYGSGSPVQWGDLAGEDEPAGDSSSLAGPFPFHERKDAPLEPTKMGHSTPSGPFEQREVMKRPRADEAQPGSGGLTLKHHRLVALR